MRVFALSALLLFVACQAPPPPEPEFTDADRQAIAAEIERLTLEMNQLGRTEDMQEFFNYLSPSADSYFAGEPAILAFGTTVYPSMQAVREFMDPSNWSRQSTNYTLESSKVAVLSPEHAVQVTEQFYTVTNAEGVTGSRMREVATKVWSKEEGQWKMIHMHLSWTTAPVEGEAEG
jgi:hypothetical protein